MKRFAVIGLIGVSVMALASCDVQPSKFSDSEALDVVEKITYIHEPRAGLCFALIASRKAMSASQSGMGMANVECTDRVMSLAVTK